MAIEGYYYLHQNGDLIYKRALDGTAADLRESDLVRAFWPVDPSDRLGAWTILVEAWVAGASGARIQELASKWGCTNDDAMVYAERVGICVQIDDPSRPDDWFAVLPSFVNIQESPSGWGPTALEAIAELAKEIGYTPQKTWGESFAQIVARLNRAVAQDGRA